MHQSFGILVEAVHGLTLNLWLTSSMRMEMLQMNSRRSRHTWHSFDGQGWRSRHILPASLEKQAHTTCQFGEAGTYYLPVWSSRHILPAKNMSFNKFFL